MNKFFSNIDKVKGVKMKKLLIFLINLVCAIFLIACSNEQKKINVNFVFEENHYILQIEKGSSINKDIYFFAEEIESIELYYDKEYIGKYDGENIYKDITIYVKKTGCLNEEIEMALKKSYILNFCNNEIGIEEIQIEKYYGNYKDNIVVLIKELNKGDSGMIKEVIIDDIVFRYPFENREILLWTREEFLPLKEAYEIGLISKIDLVEINEIYKAS